MGAWVIYDKFPVIAAAMFEKTLEKRKQTAANAAESFNK